MEVDSEDENLKNSNLLSLQKWSLKFEIDENDPVKSKDVSVWHTNNFSSTADIVFVINSMKSTEGVAREKITYIPMSSSYFTESTNCLKDNFVKKVVSSDWSGSLEKYGNYRV